AQGAADELVRAAHARNDIHVVASFDDVDADFLRAVAKQITAHPSLVALLAARTPETQYILVARGAQASFDCGAFVKRVTSAHGGRGGGRPELAEGRLPPTVDWSVMIEA